MGSEPFYLDVQDNAPYWTVRFVGGPLHNKCLLMPVGRRRVFAEEKPPTEIQYMYEIRNMDRRYVAYDLMMLRTPGGAVYYEYHLCGKVVRQVDFADTEWPPRWLSEDYLQYIDESLSGCTRAIFMAGYMLPRRRRVF